MFVHGWEPNETGLSAGFFVPVPIAFVLSRQDSSIKQGRNPYCMEHKPVKYPIELRPSASNLFMALSYDMPDFGPIWGTMEELQSGLLKREIEQHLEEVLADGWELPEPHSPRAHIGRGIMGHDTDKDSQWVMVEVEVPSPATIAKIQIDRLQERLSEFVTELPEWLATNRSGVISSVSKAVLEHYASLPDPELQEGAETSLDLLVLVLQAGINHPLYPSTIEALDRSIEDAVKALKQSEQVALLLKYCDMESASLADYDVIEWSDILVKESRKLWQRPLRYQVVEIIKNKDSHNFDKESSDDALEQLHRDQAYLESIIAAEVDVLTTDVGDHLEAIYERHNGNAELMMFFDRAAQAFSDVVLAKAKEVIVEVSFEEAMQARTKNS